jgi:hypothetical protein
MLNRLKKLYARLNVEEAILPHKMSRDNRTQLEKAGVRFGNRVGVMFVNVNLPKGWKIVPSQDDDRWSYLQDEKGVERARMFYHSDDHTASLIIVK